MNFTEKTVETREIYNGRIISLKEDTVLLPDGKKAGRELILHNGGVAVIPVDSDRNVFVVKQYRKPYERVLTEVPAGKLEFGENPYDAGLRELVEETGYKAGKYTFLGEVYPSPGYLNEIIHIYLAEDLTFVGQDLDEEEFVEVEKIPLSKLVDMVMSGEIQDAKTQIAVLKADKLLKEIKKCEM